MEWTAEEELLQDIDNLSFMTCGTPQSKIQNCGLTLKPSEPAAMTSYDSQSSELVSSMHQPSFSGKGRGAVFEKSYRNINKQAWMDNDIHAQLRNHSPYTYSNQFIEMNIGMELEDTKHITSSKDGEPTMTDPTFSTQIEDQRVVPVDEPTSAKFEGKQNVKVEDHSRQTASKVTNSKTSKTPSLYAIVTKRRANCSSSSIPNNMPCKVEGVGERHAQQITPGMSENLFSTKCQAAQSRVFINALKDIVPSYNPGNRSDEFPSLEELKKRKRR